MKEIRKRLELPVTSCGQKPVRQSFAQSLHASNRNPDCIAVRHEGRPRLIHVWRQQFQAEAVTFQNIDERIIKALAVGKTAAMNSAG